MSVLDTFFILFKTNAPEVKKGFEDTKAAGDKFDEGIGRADAHVEMVGEHIKETFKEIGLAIAGAFAAERLFEFGKENVEVNARLSETSERLGVAVDDLAALQAGAVKFGGSAEGVTQSLDFLNKGIADIAVKGTSRLKPFFDELGISAVDARGHIKPLLDIYGELANKFEGKTAQERAGLSERFGIDPGLAHALSEGAKGFDELIAREKALGVTSKEDAEAASHFEQSMHDIGTIGDHVATVLTSFLLPALQAITDAFIRFSEFTRAHSGIIQAFFIGIGGVIAAIYLPAVINAAVATWAFLLPWIAIAAAVIAAGAAFAFVVDDIANFLEGNKSVIGELSKSWPIIGEVITGVAEDIGAAFDILKDIGGPLLGFLEALGKYIGEGFVLDGKILLDYLTRLADALGLFGTVGQAAARGVGAAWQWLSDIVSSVLTFIVDGLKHLPAWLTAGTIALNATTAAAQGTPQPQTPQAAVAGAAQAEGIRAAQEQVRAADSTPLGAQTSNSVTQNQGGDKTTNVNVEKIEVHTAATDADGVAGAIGGALKPHIQSTIDQFDDGVKG